MFTKIIVRAKPERSSIGARSILVVVLLSILFAGAIIAAMRPHPVRDAAQTSSEGGL